jgi:hypothetical protein
LESVIVSASSPTGFKGGRQAGKARIDEPISSFKAGQHSSSKGKTRERTCGFTMIPVKGTMLQKGIFTALI